MKNITIGIIIGVILSIIIGAIVIFAMSSSGEYEITNGNLEVTTTYGANITFNDSQFLAIGYVPDIHLGEFVEKNFINEDDFKSINIKDFRKEENQVNGYGNRFIFVPKTSDVKVEIYDCFINENGEVELDNRLIANEVGSFILLDDYMPESTTPTICIKLEYCGFEDIVPIVFSGKDGKLDLTGHEAEVKDISIYNN